MTWPMVVRAMASRSELRVLLTRLDPHVQLGTWATTRLTADMLAVPAYVAIFTLAISTWGRHRINSAGDVFGIGLVTAVIALSAAFWRVWWRTTFRAPLCADLQAIAGVVGNDCAGVISDSGREGDRRASPPELVPQLQALRSDADRHSLRGLRAVVLGDTLVGHLFVGLASLCSALVGASYVFSHALLAATWSVGVIAVTCGISVRALWIRERVQRAVKAVIEARCAHCGYPVPFVGARSVTCAECGHSQPSRSSVTAQSLDLAAGIEKH